MDSVVTTKRLGKVLEITLNRPKVNAIDKATSMALYAAFHTLQEDDDLLVGIITGTDRAFSAGWDLKTVAAAETTEDLDALMHLPERYLCHALRVRTNIDDFKLLSGCLYAK